MKMSTKQIFINKLNLKTMNTIIAIFILLYIINLWDLIKNDKCFYDNFLTLLQGFYLLFGSAIIFFVVYSYVLNLLHKKLF